ncbi:MAG: hypothetical protein ACOY82_12180 [Pseudomonadota bacterium]
MEIRLSAAIGTVLFALATIGPPSPAIAQNSPWSRLAACDAAFTQHRYRTAPLSPGENANEPACAARRDTCLAAAGSNAIARNECMIEYNLCVLGGQGANNRLQSPYGFGMIAECYVHSYVEPGDLSATYCDNARALRDLAIFEYQACQDIADPDARFACSDAAMTKAWISSGVMNCE